MLGRINHHKRLYHVERLLLLALWFNISQELLLELIESITLLGLGYFSFEILKNEFSVLEETIRLVNLGKLSGDGITHDEITSLVVLG